MDWYLAAPFIHEASDLWLANFVPGGSARFHAVPGRYAHDRSRRLTNLRGWGDYFQHGAAVWRAARRNSGPYGILTCFPQLPLTVGLQKRLTRSRAPVVAWTFNVGTLHGGARQRLARAALCAVDRFVVHSRAELASCSEWLDLPPSRFEFVPLQRGVRDITFAEDRGRPFLLSMGSAHRDYRLLFGVLAELGYPAVVVAGSHAVAGLHVPSNVEVRSGLSVQQCHELVQRARVNVIPVDNRHTASGQVTMLDAMMFGRPTIVTDCPASVDYVTHRHDAMLVKHGDHDDLKTRIEELWQDGALRGAIGQAARHTVVERFSDEAIGRVMGRVLAEVEAADRG